MYLSIRVTATTLEIADKPAHLAREVLDSIGGALDAGHRQNFPEKFRLPLR